MWLKNFTAKIFKKVWKKLKENLSEILSLWISLLLLLLLAVCISSCVALTVLSDHYLQRLFSTISEKKETLNNNFMFKLERLALAILDREGWCPVCYNGNENGSLTYRHHNPGALRSSPKQVATKNGFAVFASDFEGFNALIWDLEQKAKGKTSTGLNGNSTLKDLINKWAPKEDNNDPKSYLAFICERTNFKPDMKLKELLN